MEEIMTEFELVQRLYSLNESEIFYKRYQEAKKSEYEWNRFFRYLNIEELKEKHIIVPEIKETMPPSMTYEAQLLLSKV